MTVYASIAQRESGLWTDFGYGFALRLFGQEALNNLPRFSRGKNTGKPRAIIRWRKVERGGWISEGPAYMGEPGTNGHVERRVGKVISASIHESQWGKEPGPAILSWRLGEGD